MVKQIKMGRFDCFTMTVLKAEESEAPVGHDMTAVGCGSGSCSGLEVTRSPEPEL